MTFRFTRLLQRFNFARQIHSDSTQLQSASDNTIELGDLRKFSLNSLLAFLAIPSASATLQPAALTLLLYTNNLRLSNTCFLSNHATLSRVLHVIPLLVVSCMASIQLASAVESPVIAAVALFSGLLPLLTIAVRFGGKLVGIIAEESTPALPVRMHYIVAPATLGSAESGEADGRQSRSTGVRFDD